MIRGYGDNMDVEVNCQSAERKKNYYFIISVIHPSSCGAKI